MLNSFIKYASEVGLTFEDISYFVAANFEVEKRALAAETTKGITPLIAGTVGRLEALPIGLLLEHEKALKHVVGPDEKEIKKIVEELKKDKDLKETEVHMGGSRPLRDIQRAWNNKRMSLPYRLLGAVASGPMSIASDLRRSDNYNSFADSVNLYSGVPEILRHELGHAKDINQKKYPGLYTHSRAVGGVFSPVAQWQESMANREAMKNLGEPSARREFRRRVWPARSTYITAPLIAAAMLSGGAAMGPLVPLAGVAGGAVLARLAAEGRNLFDRDKKKKKDE